MEIESTDGKNKSSQFKSCAIIRNDYSQITDSQRNEQAELAYSKNHHSDNAERLRHYNEAVDSARKARNNAAKQLQNKAVSAIKKIDQIVGQLITTLLIIKGVLVTEVLRQTDREIRKLQRSAEHNSKAQLSVDLEALQSESNDEVSVLRDQGSGSCLTLIAPQLLELVKTLQQQVYTVSDKLRTLTVTSQVILSVGGNASGVTSDAQAYDPVSQKWTQACSMHRRRYLTAATSRNGKVVVAGGFTDESEYDETVEEYDPVSNSWSWLSNLLVGRQKHALVTLDDRIYALGGSTKLGTTGTVEVLDKNGTQWAHAEPMSVERQELTAVAIQRYIIVAGGLQSDRITTAKCEKLDAQLNQWSIIASLKTPRRLAAAAAHLNSVFVFGGENKVSFLDSIELYDLKKNEWTLLKGKLTVARAQLAAVYLDKCVYLLGGHTSVYVGESTKANECFNVNTMQLTKLKPMPKNLNGFAASYAAVGEKQMPAIGVTNRLILCVGGYRSKYYLSSVEAYVPANDTWYTLSQMHTPRFAASATSWNNKVVVAGGLPECNLRSVQQYDLLSNTWTSMPPLIEERSGFALVNLNEALLAIGGWPYKQSVERFNEGTNRWNLATPLNLGRSRFAAAVLQHRIIVAGGFDGKQFNSCEAFDQLTNKWSCIAPLNKSRSTARGTSDGINFYVFGGRQDTVEQYDATADKWTILQLTFPVLNVLQNFAVSCVNSHIHILGGVKRAHFLSESTMCLKPDKRLYLTKAFLAVACSDLCAVSVDVSDEALFTVLLPLL